MSQDDKVSEAFVLREIAECEALAEQCLVPSAERAPVTREIHDEDIKPLADAIAGVLDAGQDIGQIRARAHIPLMSRFEWYRVVGVLRGDIVVPSSELARLREFQRKIEEAEARCCPEDVGFEEWIGVLKRQVGERDVQIGTLTAAINAMNQAPNSARGARVCGAFVMTGSACPDCPTLENCRVLRDRYIGGSSEGAAK